MDRELFLARRRRKHKKHVEEMRALVKAIRDQTVCVACGGQPIEWHNPSHSGHPTRRVSQMLMRTRGVIEAEIARCTPLCGPCHAKVDGAHVLTPARAAAYAKQITPPVPCSVCQRPTKPTWLGMCRTCYMRTVYWPRRRQAAAALAAANRPPTVPYVEVDQVTEYGQTFRLQRSIRVF